MYNLLLLMGASGSGSGQAANPFIGFLPLIAIILVIYFFMLRPQAKKQKEHREMLARLEKGDKVLTAGGIVGTVAGIKEKEGLVVLKIADNVKIELSRNSIGQVLKKRSEQ